MATQETCRCAVADCALHQSACDLVDLLKEVEEFMHGGAAIENYTEQELKRKIALTIARATKAEGR